MGFKNKVAISKHALRLAFTDKLSWLLLAWLLGAQWTYGQEVNPSKMFKNTTRTQASWPKPINK